MLTIEITNRGGLDYLHAVLQRAQDLRPVLPEIGEDMTESTKQRFASATAPDGSAWAPNSTVTLANYGVNFARKKDGTPTKRSAQKLASKKPLMGETRALETTINYQVTGSHSVSIGSPMVYAAMQQHGGTKGDFPHLWGDIPARQYLGASDADKANVVSLVRRYLLEG
jgi:phage virion morphogenesis protein